MKFDLGLNPKNQRFDRGFSLFEMIVAIAILGLALSVLYQSIAGATRNLRISAEYAYASALAESTMDDFASEVTIGKVSTGQSDIYQWNAEVTPLESWLPSAPDALQQPDLAMITVSVSWLGVAGYREVSLQTIAIVKGVSGAS